MAETIVLPAKRQQDIQAYTISFANILTPGDEIFSATVTVRVFSGIDPTPSHILDGLHQFDTTTVTQKVQAGLVGVIYELLFSVTTVAGFLYTIETRLAILPYSFPAVPNYFPYTLTSKPYHILYTEAGSQTSEFVSGILRDIFVDTGFLDSVSAPITFLSGDLRDAFIETSYLESIYTPVVFSDGALRDAFIDTSYLEEIYQEVTFVDGLLRDALITTNYVESVENTVEFLSGTLYVP